MGYFSGRRRMLLNRSIRILVAEDDPAFLNMVEDSLRESGGTYQVERVSSGDECLEKLQSEKFDILLLDHLLSDGKGLDWLRRFNDLGIDIPTIFVTAKGDPRLAIEAMKEGVFDYINRSAECAKAFPFVVNRAVEGYGLMVEKVRLQKELIETKNFLESIVEKAGDAISVVDREGKVLYWNEGAERIYGYSKEEVKGKKLSEFLIPQRREIEGRRKEIHEGPDEPCRTGGGYTQCGGETANKGRKGDHHEHDDLTPEGCRGEHHRGLTDLQRHHSSQKGGGASGPCRAIVLPGRADGRGRPRTPEPSGRDQDQYSGPAAEEGPS